MPFTKARYKTRTKYKKYRRCLRKLKGRKNVNPFAICRSSIYK